MKFLISFLIIYLIINLFSNQRENYIHFVLKNPNEIQVIIKDTLNKGKYIKKYYKQVPTKLIEYIKEMNNKYQVKSLGFSIINNHILFKYKVNKFNSTKGGDEGLYMYLTYDNYKLFLYYIYLY